MASWIVSSFSRARDPVSISARAGWLLMCTTMTSVAAFLCKVTEWGSMTDSLPDQTILQEFRVQGPLYTNYPDQDCHHPLGQCFINRDAGSSKHRAIW
ncbi:hypothetical protein EDC04DRAFT_2799612 [Pisolithus marmoratus]|nr:hypothetical protein EDC04DRAFT_2799612 [Pisolithus marmoratus]